MCGICGIIQHDAAQPVNQAVLLRMCAALTHRGPDDDGIYLDGSAGLGSRRLAIIDLSPRGHMPMASPDGRYWITYNGEIYNYRELRAGLEARGVTFRSQTDTEVLLALYLADGPTMLARCNGMFAFALWDSYERTLFLARDRLGIKPLYYAWHQGSFYFASEEKALFIAGVPMQFDRATLEELLCFRYVAGERTPFAGVQRLLPGHYLLWRAGVVRMCRWWNLGERVREYHAPLTDLVGWYRDTLDDAVDLRRISDVPVGVLLSGGLDSSSIAASLALQSETQVSSFTVRFSQADYDESALAKQVARRWNLDYHDIVVEATELLEWLEQAIWLNDEPLAHGNDPHLLALSQYAKSRVTVLLSGEGADETLGGYVRYQPLKYRQFLGGARLFLPALRQITGWQGRVAKLSRFLALDSLRQFILLNACEVLPHDLARLGLEPVKQFPFREQILAEAEALYPHDWMRQAMYSDQHTFLCSILDRNDRMTMGASIECRVPFLDYRLVEMTAYLPTRTLMAHTRTKRLLRESAASRLPAATLQTRKWGFGVPWKDYLRTDGILRDRFQTMSASPLLLDLAIDRIALAELVQSFLAGDDRSFSLLFQVFMLTEWWNVYSARLERLRAESIQAG